MEEPTVSLLECDGLAVVLLQGSASVETCARLHALLLQAGPDRNVAVDWERVEHVSAATVQVLLALQRRLAQRGFSLSVLKDNRRVRNYLEMAGLADYFPLRPAAPASAEVSNA